MDWILNVEVDGSLDLTPAGDMPVGLLILLHEKVESHPELHDGRHCVVVTEFKFKNVNAPLDKYSWSPRERDA